MYASYDAMGNMTCRNVDTTSSHGCDAAQSGAIMTYDNEGRLDTWVTPNGTVASDQYLYDNSGQRVLQRASNTVGSTTTTSDTISFDGFTDVTYHRRYNLDHQVLQCRWTKSGDAPGWHLLLSDARLLRKQ
ncbi:hypothetical protein KDK_69360 [Dictyobacter kobayashii]|uniref:Uncharacterized protein n=1 Tax=Dictyobacter kobayashii TaxID=2014872 RepID=A0A402AVJ3_9CHLR|nr:hypothetical protein KDK_69360 [Dictyobacter kobayashii]